MNYEVRCQNNSICIVAQSERRTSIPVMMGVDSAEKQNPKEVPKELGNVRPGEHTIILPKRKVVVEPVLFMVALVSWPYFSVATQYILERTYEDMAGDVVYKSNASCGDIPEDDPVYIFEKQVQERSAYLSMLIDISKNLPVFFVGPLLGAYSDKIGRKYMMFLGLLGLAINMLSYIMVAYFVLPVWVLIVGGVIEGLTGSMALVIMSGHSYLADTTSLENRALRMTVAEILMLLPTIASLVIVGFLIENLGYIWPGVIALGGTVLNAVYVAFFVPHTFEPMKGAKFFDFSHVKTTIKLFTKDDGSNRKSRLILVLLIHFPAYTAILGGLGIYIFYVSDFPLCWDSIFIGVFSGSYIAVGTIGGLISYKLMNNRLSDPWIVFVGLAWYFVFNLYTAFIQNTPMMFIAVGGAVMSEIALPRNRVMASKYVKHDEHGALFSGITSLESLATTLSRVVIFPVYAATNTIFHGTVYVVTSFFFLLSIITSGIFIKMYGKDRELELPKSSNKKYFQDKQKSVDINQKF